MDFTSSDAPVRAFVGGVGSGKSFVGALDLLLRAVPGRLYMVTAPTYPMLRDATLRVFRSLARRLGTLHSFSRSEMTAAMTNGAEVLFRSTDDPDRLRGPNLSGCWMDEASLSAREAYDVLLGRLREQGETGWLAATFTPRGRANWTFAAFGGLPPGAGLFHARTDDNPFLPAGFADVLRAHYTSHQAGADVEGLFMDPEGALFRREWFRLAGSAPPCPSRVRRWDLASTETRPGADPDWTAGALLGRDAGGRFWVLDVVRARVAPGAVEDLVLQTAQLDGRGVPVRMEQEPGSSGVAVVDHYARRVLAGWDFRGVRSTGDKATRARPLAAQAEHGNVSVLLAPWTRGLLDELEAFPGGTHDDMVDALSGAFLDLTGGGMADFTRAALGVGGTRAAAGLRDLGGPGGRGWDARDLGAY
jgi:predicted phage terminase large subunit-like protein